MTCGYPKGNCRHKDLNFGPLEKAERCELVTGVTEQAVCGTWERGKVGEQSAGGGQALPVTAELASCSDLPHRIVGYRLGRMAPSGRAGGPRGGLIMS